MNRLDYSVARPASNALVVNKVIRNSYTLLAATLFFSALMAAVSVMLRMPPMTYLLSLGGAMLHNLSELFEERSRRRRSRTRANTAVPVRTGRIAGQPRV